MKPEEVFTPRRAEVNSEMYVSRPRLEAALSGGIRSRLHLVIKGESGCGKSWLYKKVFAEAGVYFRTVNLASALTCGSVAEAAVRTVLGGTSRPMESERQVVTFATVLQALGISRRTAERFQHVSDEPFLACVRAMRALAKKKRAYVVFENLEQIARSEELLKQLSSLLMFIDDEAYAQSDVQICLVGTPTNITELLRRAGNTAIQNRVCEIPEVSRLSQEDAETLVRTGFVDLLGYRPEAVETVCEEVTWMADRIPQHLHSLCFQLAIAAEPRSRRKIDSETMLDASIRWLESQEASAYATICAKMSHTRQAVSRKNQVLYALAQLDREAFSYRMVEEKVREEFPQTTANKQLAIAAILSELAEGASPILRRSPLGTGLYQFVNPLYRITMRVMLVSTETESVEVLSSEDLQRRLHDASDDDRAETA